MTENSTIDDLADEVSMMKIRATEDAGRISVCENQLQALAKAYNELSQILVEHGLAKNEGTRKL